MLNRAKGIIPFKWITMTSGKETNRIMGNEAEYKNHRRESQKAIRNVFILCINQEGILKYQ